MTSSCLKYIKSIYANIILFLLHNNTVWDGLIILYLKIINVLDFASLIENKLEVNVNMETKNLSTEALVVHPTRTIKMAKYPNIPRKEKLHQPLRWRILSPLYLSLSRRRPGVSKHSIAWHRTHLPLPTMDVNQASALSRRKVTFPRVEYYTKLDT